MSEKNQQEIIEEEGEIQDSDNENDSRSISSDKPVESSFEVKTDMDVESDVEDSKIDVKPIAMSVKFYNEKVKQRFLDEIHEKFGRERVECNHSCLFVYPEKCSKEIVKTVVAPSGLLRILFHDEAFRDQHIDSMVHLCKKIFGKWKVTNDEASIDVFEDEILDFEIDTSTRRQNNVFYNKSEVKEEGNNKRQAGSCFNCGGAHGLNSCQEPKNFQRINENRQNFMSRKVQSKKRYHFERDQFSGSSAGHLSEGLRKAMGLEENQLPRFIYRMRKFGYPPAWLLEAKIKHSGVAVYGRDGAVPEEGDDPGEIFEEGEKDRYDIQKIIRFPGFNSPIPDGFIDEHDSYDCPPLDEEQSLEAMTQRLAPNAYQAYKKRKAIVTDQQESPEISVAVKTPVQEQKTPTRSISVDLGTPVLPPTSPFTKLPERNKFGLNISEVINFENLPDSTGTYEKVASSITKIRELAKNSD